MPGSLDNADGVENETQRREAVSEPLSQGHRSTEWDRQGLSSGHGLDPGLGTKKPPRGLGCQVSYLSIQEGSGRGKAAIPTAAPQTRRRHLPARTLRLNEPRGPGTSLQRTERQTEVPSPAPGGRGLGPVLTPGPTTRAVHPNPRGKAPKSASSSHLGNPATISWYHGRKGGAHGPQGKGRVGSADQFVTCKLASLISFLPHPPCTCTCTCQSSGLSLQTEQPAPKRSQSFLAPHGQSPSAPPHSFLPTRPWGHQPGSIPELSGF